MSSTAVRRRSATVPIALTVAAIAFTGAIFGFFYAWVCSTMWGLDAADPTVAITAMNAMNSSVRNWVFAPVFFGTVVVLAAATVAAGTSRDRRATILLGAATVIYFGGAFLLTQLVNVPMNEQLASTVIPASREAASEIWSAYSGTWQQFNVIRTAASGTALLLSCLALVALSARARER
jgi:uncharacterized membrane protein